MDLHILAADTNSAAYTAGTLIGGLIGLLLLFAVPIAFVVLLVMAIRRKSTGWIVGAVLAGVATLTLVGFIGYGVMKGLEAAREMAGEAAGPNGEIVSQDGLSRITAPKNWRALKGINEEADLQAGNGLRNEFLIVLTESKEDFGGTLEEHSEITSSALVGSLENAEVSDPVKLTINGLPAIQREISGRVSGIDAEYLHTSIEGKGSFHQVLAWTLRSQRDRAFPILENAVATFEEVAPEAAAQPSPAAKTP